MSILIWKFQRKYILLLNRKWNKMLIVKNQLEHLKQKLEPQKESNVCINAFSVMTVNILDPDLWLSDRVVDVFFRYKKTLKHFGTPDFVLNSIQYSNL